MAVSDTINFGKGAGWPAPRELETSHIDNITFSFAHSRYNA